MCNTSHHTWFKFIYNLIKTFFLCCNPICTKETDIFSTFFYNIFLIDFLSYPLLVFPCFSDFFTGFLCSLAWDSMGLETCSSSAAGSVPSMGHLPWIHKMAQVLVFPKKILFPGILGCEYMHLKRLQFIPWLHIGTCLCSNLHFSPVFSSYSQFPEFT